MVSDYPLHVANSLIIKREIFYTALEIFFADKYGGKLVQFEMSKGCRHICRQPLDKY
jgi:hypothetical protein